MYRNIEDIIKSQDKLIVSGGQTWTERYEEKYRQIYKELYDDSRIKWSDPISIIKYYIWENIQTKKLKNPFYNLDYESLKSHEDWLDKDNRKHFAFNQIK